MALSFCKIREAAQCVIDWKNGIDVPWSTSDSDNQTLAVDCDGGTLTISGGNTVPLDQLGTVTVWSAPLQAPGFTWERWSGGDAGGSAAGDEAGWTQSWSGPAVDGIPGHVNGAPTVSGVETDTRYAQSAAQGEQGRDDHRLCYWVWNDTGSPIDLLDVDTRAESWRVYGGCPGCPAALLQEQYQNDPGPSNSQGVPFLTLLPGGWTKLTVLIHDPGNDFSGFWLRARTVGDTALFDPATFQAEPTVECVQKAACDVAETDLPKPPVLDCHQCGGGGLDSDAVQALIDASTPAPATAVPIPDNETDTAIRTGQTGTSTDYARADHNHPISRQTILPDPAIAAGGNLTLIQSLVLDRWSEEEHIAYRWRTRISQPAGNGWGWLTVPTIAGFQQPDISAIGTYRNPSTEIQNDDGTFGAAPRGPYMGAEAHHWSSTNRVYAGFFRRDDALTSMFVEFTVKYRRV